jgi:hypothetical protein
MLSTVHSKKGLQLFFGLITGIVFGFLLQKGGVTNYDVILGQLLLTDFTVVKIMLSAVITGMVGVYLLKSLGLAQLHPKPDSLGGSVIGGLIFGVGFGTLGYCPGTLSGALGQGHLDALFGGVVGILIGAGLFAALYPKLETSVLHLGGFGKRTIPQALKVNEWVIIVPSAVLLIAILVVLERLGL